MIAKYIRCDVLKASRERFSSGQNLWHETASSKGFISQLGGWETKTDRAIILAQWSDMDSVKRFMRVDHDAIAEKTHQVGSYSQLCVSYLTSVMSIPVSEKNNHQSGTCGFMRIADCYIYPDKVDEFIREQEELWNPGMQQVEGMLDGQLWQFNDEINRYLVTSFWQSESHHQHYTSEHFPGLKKQAATNIIQKISGHRVPTEPSWQIKF